MPASLYFWDGLKKVMSHQKLYLPGMRLYWFQYDAFQYQEVNKTHWLIQKWSNKINVNLTP